MRSSPILIAAFGALLALAAFAQAPESATIQGIVIDKTTGAPIAGATVELTGINDRQARFSSSPISPSKDDGAEFTLQVQQTETEGNYRVFSLSATTDNDGKFRIANIRPGSGYQLVAYHVGRVDKVRDPRALLPYQRLASLIGEHFPVQYGQPALILPGIPIALAAGELRNDIVIEMARTGSISGRVMGTGGVPLRDVMVAATEGTVGHQTDNRSVQTNANGEYRILGLVPGQYFLSVRAPRNLKYMPAVYADKGASSASLIEILEGSNLTNLDFNLLKAEKKSVQGTVIDKRTGQPVKRAEITATPNFRTSFTSGSVFRLEMLPGSYVLLAAANDQGTSLRGSLPIEVRDMDLKDLTIEVAP
jgi:protocatechuate 3,4-dioxygenase beta subunit